MALRPIPYRKRHHPDTAIKGSMYENIHAQYLRACVKEFEVLNLTQDTSCLNVSVAAESVFFNNRFDLARRGTGRSRH